MQSLRLGGAGAPRPGVLEAPQGWEECDPNHEALGAQSHQPWTPVGGEELDAHLGCGWARVRGGSAFWNSHVYRGSVSVVLEMSVPTESVRLHPTTLHQAAARTCAFSLGGVGVPSCKRINMGSKWDK